MNDKKTWISDKVSSRGQYQEIDLLELGMVFLDHVKFIIVWFLAGALVVGAYSFFLISPTYQSTAKMYVVSTSNDSIVDLTDLNIGTSLTADYEELITCDPVVEQVISDLNLDMTKEDVLSMIAIENPENTRVLQITATTTDPEFSKELANEFMDVSLDYLPETMSTNPPNVAQRAKTPDQKAGPSNMKNTLIGAILGLLISCGWLTIQYLRDDTIHSAEEMETYFELVPLTTIPESSELSDDGDRDIKKKKRRLKGRGGKK